MHRTGAGKWGIEKYGQLTKEQNNHEVVCFAVHCILLIVADTAAPPKA